MWCPECKSEYVVGITKCPECEVPLVDRLPEEPREKPAYVKYEEVLYTHNPGDVAIIKSILDSENIEYYFVGEYTSMARLWVDPARLMVKKDQVEKAKELLEDFI